MGCFSSTPTKEEMESDMDKSQAPNTTEKIPVANSDDQLVKDDVSHRREEEEEKKRKEKDENNKNLEPKNQKTETKILTDIILLNTKWYEVKVKTMLREDSEMKSKRIKMLHPGTRVKAVKELSGSVQITEPVEGWLCLQTEGVKLLEEIDINAEKKSDEAEIEINAEKNPEPEIEKIPAADAEPKAKYADAPTFFHSLSPAEQKHTLSLVQGETYNRSVMDKLTNETLHEPGQIKEFLSWWFLEREDVDEESVNENSVNVNPEEVTEFDEEESEDMDASMPHIVPAKRRNSNEDEENSQFADKKFKVLVTVPLRESADIESKMLNFLKAGTEVKLLGKKGNLVQIQDPAGWCSFTNKGAPVFEEIVSYTGAPAFFQSLSPDEQKHTLSLVQGETYNQSVMNKLTEQTLHEPGQIKEFLTWWFLEASPFPKSYRTVDKVIVRKTEDPNSQMLNFLPKDTEVTVEEIQGQRARISFPLGGWVSIKTADKDLLIPIEDDLSGNNLSSGIRKSALAESVKKTLRSSKDGIVDYKVQVNTTVRAELGTKSKTISFLKSGTLVKVIEQDGNAVRITEPINGWVSLETAGGVYILTKVKNPSANQFDPQPESSKKNPEPHGQQEIEIVYDVNYNAAAGKNDVFGIVPTESIRQLPNEELNLSGAKQSSTVFAGNPRYYHCNMKSIIYAEEDVNSKVVGFLKPGTDVFAVEETRDFLKIQKPFPGWVRFYDAQGFELFTEVEVHEDIGSSSRRNRPLFSSTSRPRFYAE